jgi:hypothetical protein
LGHPFGISIKFKIIPSNKEMGCLLFLLCISLLVCFNGAAAKICASWRENTHLWSSVGEKVAVLHREGFIPHAGDQVTWDIVDSKEYSDEFFMYSTNSFWQDALLDQNSLPMSRFTQMLRIMLLEGNTMQTYWDALPAIENGSSDRILYVYSLEDEVKVLKSLQILLNAFVGNENFVYKDESGDIEFCDKLVRDFLNVVEVAEKIITDIEYSYLDSLLDAATFDVTFEQFLTHVETLLVHEDLNNEAQNLLFIYLRASVFPCVSRYFARSKKSSVGRLAVALTNDTILPQEEEKVIITHRNHEILIRAASLPTESTAATTTTQNENILISYATRMFFAYVYFYL